MYKMTHGRRENDEYDDVNQLDISLIYLLSLSLLLLSLFFFSLRFSVLILYFATRKNYTSRVGFLFNLPISVPVVSVLSPSSRSYKRSTCPRACPSPVGSRRSCAARENEKSPRARQSDAAFRETRTVVTAIYVICHRRLDEETALSTDGVPAATGPSVIRIDLRLIDIARVFSCASANASLSPFLDRS